MLFFFNDTASTEIYTLSLHDALPIYTNFFGGPASLVDVRKTLGDADALFADQRSKDRKSTRLNSSHSSISYAVFCLKKKNTPRRSTTGRSGTTTRPSASTPKTHTPST